MNEKKPLSQMDVNGEFTCEYCGNPFVQQRYKVHYDEELWFCLPECLVGYEWYVIGRNQESEQDRAMCISQFEQAFKRQVIPAPFSCFLKTETRPREQWLHEECRKNLKDKDKSQANAELRIINTLRRGF
jgi:hypothetical protein